MNNTDNQTVSALKTLLGLCLAMERAAHEDNWDELEQLDNRRQSSIADIKVCAGLKPDHMPLIQQIQQLDDSICQIVNHKRTLTLQQLKKSRQQNSANQHYRVCQNSTR